MSSTPSSPVEECEPDIRTSAVSLPSMDRSSFQLDITPSAPASAHLDDDRYVSEPNLAVRSETPPPAYNDILTTDDLSIR